MSENRKVLVDARGLSCPGPITEIVKAYRNLRNGDMIEIWATDPGFKPDVEAWVKRTGNQLVEIKQDNDKIVALIKITAKK